MCIAEMLDSVENGTGVKPGHFRLAHTWRSVFADDVDQGFPTTKQQDLRGEFGWMDVTVAPETLEDCCGRGCNLWREVLRIEVKRAMSVRQFNTNNTCHIAT